MGSIFIKMHLKYCQHFNQATIVVMAQGCHGIDS